MCEKSALSFLVVEEARSALIRSAALTTFPRTAYSMLRIVWDIVVRLRRFPVGIIGLFESSFRVCFLIGSMDLVGGQFGNLFVGCLFCFVLDPMMIMMGLGFGVGV